MFLGYRFVINEFEHYYYAADEIQDVEGVWSYIQKYILYHPMIRITDSASDDLCVEAVEGRIVFPKQWAVMDLINLYRVAPESFTRIHYLHELQVRGLLESLMVVPGNMNDALKSLDLLLKVYSLSSNLEGLKLR